MTKLGRARRWLVELLSDGPVPARRVGSEAAKVPIAPATLRKAAVAERVVKVREGELGSAEQRWVWSLPSEEQLADADEAVSVTESEPVGPEPLEVLTGLRLEDGSTWGSKAVELQWSDGQAVLARAPAARRFWLGRPRGYSKTSDCAAFTIAAALSGLIPPGERGLVAAGDRDQAGLVSQAVAGFVRRTGELHGVVQVERSEIKFPTVGVVVEVMSSDAPTAWGRRVHWAVIDELPAWADTPNSHEFYDALSSAWAKVPACRAVIIGTASSPSHFARRHYETAAASDSWMLSDTHDTAPWMLASDVEDQRRSLSEGTFARLFENRWTQAEDHLVTAENLRRCVAVTDWPAKPKPGTKYLVGVDLATKFDSTAICVAHAERRDGERHVLVDDMEVFAPKRGTEVSLADVERRVEQLAKRYWPADVFFDPQNASLMLENLRGRGVHVAEFKFTAATNDRMTNALHVMLRDALIQLPNDERLLDELLSVRVVETRLGGLKVDTLPGRHDDQVDALGIAVVTFMDRSASTGGAGFGTNSLGYIPIPGAADRLATTNPLIDNTFGLAERVFRRQS